jgi:hypothetical protein
MDIRKSRDTETSLMCPSNNIQQSSEGGQNHFNCHLVIHVSDDSFVQSADEQGAITQTAIGGGNHSSIDLEISLTSSIKCTACAEQHQNAWQRAFVTQNASAGAENHSDVSETQYLREKIAGATTSDQFQNTAGIAASGFEDCNQASTSTVTDPNSCAVITQNGIPDSGHQESQLNLLNDLDARTTATTGSQNQGCLGAETRCSGVTTGLDGTVPQPTSGSTDTSHEDYNERQDVTAGAAGVGAVDQNQTAPQSCCALQTGSAPNSLVNADQTSTQNASTSTAPLNALALSFPNVDATQITFLSGKIQTDGSGRLDQTGHQNNETSPPAGCTLPPPSDSPTPLEDGAPACASVLFMVDGTALECSPGDIPTLGEGGLFCYTPPPPPPLL